MDASRSMGARADREGFLRRARRRIVIFDGGMGSSLRALGAPEGGCLELLNETQPDLVRQVHDGFLAAGADVIETNSFGGARHTLEEHGLGERCSELNRKAAEIARRAADAHTTPRARRYVAGSIGPGAKLPSLGQIDFAQLRESYRPQVEGLLAGSVDCLVVETCQDLLQLKAALVCIDEVFAALGRRVPILAQVTIDEHGRTLLGADVPAVLAMLAPFPIAGIGLNCGLGPAGMGAAIRYLAEHSPKLLSVMPNAGLPQLRDGRAVYDLSPEEFARQMKHFAADAGLNVAGGCCGTTPAHIRALSQALRGIAPRRLRPLAAQVSSPFSAQAIDVRPKPLICGERTNASGSHVFRARLRACDWDGMVQLAREQREEGAHLVDLSVAAAGRDELADMREICVRLNTQLDLPVVIDSTGPHTVEAALERLGGRSIVNSVNLEDRERAERTIALCRRHGAALVLMAIDARGMAMTAARKLEVAEQLYDLAVTQGGLDPESVFFDFLTFTLASGEPSLRAAAHETLQAIRAAQKRFRRSFTLLGVSNVSHGLTPPARLALNSVFLHHAIEHGLDAAILHAGRVAPLSAFAPAVVRACDDLIFNRTQRAGTPLEHLVALFAEPQESAPREASADRSRAPDLLRRAVREGDAAALRVAVGELLKRKQALAIIDNDLMPAMAEVGRLFDAGEMQLPFVLRSAEAMRGALETLRPHLGSAAARARGRLLLATVRGDIHDIGKNLVGMIVSSNGFDVVDLGVRQSAEEIVSAVRRHAPDAIGLSGLLVESARAMKEYVATFTDNGISLPVLCGGAALTRAYVESTLAPAYCGRVFYAKDAMDGLRIMHGIVRRPPRPQAAVRSAVASARRPRPPSVQGATASARRPSFAGTRMARVSVKRIAPLLDREVLYRKRWQMLRAHATQEQRRKAAATLERMLRAYTRRGILRGAVVCAEFQARAEGKEIVVLHPSSGAELSRLRLSPGFCRRAIRQHGVGEFPIALQLVTLGERVTAECRRLAAQGDVHEQFLLHGLAAELTEALAEYAQRQLLRLPRARRTLRYSPGYPIWPELAEQQKIFALLRPKRIGVTLTPQFQMMPEYSTSAIVVPGM